MLTHLLFMMFTTELFYMLLITHVLLSFTAARLNQYIYFLRIFRVCDNYNIKVVLRLASDCFNSFNKFNTEFTLI